MCLDELERLVKSDDSNLGLVMLGALFIKHLSEKKQNELIAKYKVQIQIFGWKKCANIITVYM